MLRLLRYPWCVIIIMSCFYCSELNFVLARRTRSFIVPISSWHLPVAYCTKLRASSALCPLSALHFVLSDFLSERRDGISPPSTCSLVVPTVPTGNAYTLYTPGNHAIPYIIMLSVLLSLYHTTSCYIVSSSTLPVVARNPLLL